MLSRHSESGTISVKSPITEEPQYFWIAPKTEIMVVRVDGKIRAFHSLCPHMGARLEYDASKRSVDCPWHGLSYSTRSLESGHHRYRKLCELNVEVRDNQLFILGIDT